MQTESERIEPAIGRSEPKPNRKGLVAPLREAAVWRPIRDGWRPPTVTLVDCGSWVNVSPLINDPKHAFWNRQIGILSGTEAAVLQIGSTEEVLAQ